MNKQQFEFLLASFMEACERGLTNREAFAWALEHSLFVYGDGPVLLSPKGILSASEVSNLKEVMPKNK